MRFLRVTLTIAVVAAVTACLHAGDATDLAWQLRLAERRQWWSLQPVVRPQVPIVRDAAWSQNAVDGFILASLESRNLQPAPRASRATLIRRLSFVLTGLPPDPADVQRFVADESPGAYEKLVDRTLASPHFGERWARHWMDVVRYGDTYGYEWDIAAKGAWQYRDYLIRGFNADVPFDQLIREHVAGDLLDQPRTDPPGEINESIIGTMFFQLGEKRHGDSQFFNGVHQEMLDNKIDAFAKAFQGTTIACARCHDHKLDAVSQVDYYALAGIFMSSRWVTNTADLPKRNADILKRLRELKPKIRAAIGPRWVAASKEILKQLAADVLPSAWAKAMPDAKAGAEEHPLYPFLQVLHSDDAQATWRQLASRYAQLRAERQSRNAAGFKLIWDFRDGVPSGWSVDGVGLRDGVVACGDFTVALEGPSVIGLILPGGLYTNALSPRMNGVLRTPYTSVFDTSRITIEACGGMFGAYRTVIDNGFLCEEQHYFAGSAPKWIKLTNRHDLPQRKTYIELATKTSNPNFPPRVNLGGAYTEAQAADPRSWFGVTRVMLNEKDAAPEDELTRFAPLFEGDAPRDVAGVADRYANWLGKSIQTWVTGAASEDDVKLLDWMVRSELLPNSFDVAADTDLRALVTAYRDLEKQLATPVTTNGMADLDPGYDYRVNIRGVYSDLGDAAPRGYPASLGGTGEPFATAGSGRRELAETVASPLNPLTGRVFVNRVWHWLFGTGIVATPDDFGRLGEAPSHPQLLDYLASRFVDSTSSDGLGWSAKKLIRLIVTSEAFCQDSNTSDGARTADPSNRLLHHYPLRRLEAEAVRDAVLAVSGRLDGALYGPPVNPMRAVEDPQKRLFSGPLDGDGRRSIYVLSSVMEPTKFLQTFNQPNPKIPTGRRDVTNVPAQALAMLNDPLVAQQAEFWAKRLVTEPHKSAEDRLAAMFRRAFARDLNPAEGQRWKGLVTDLAAVNKVTDDQVLSAAAVWKDVAHAMFNAKEFIYVR